MYSFGYRQYEPPTLSFTRQRFTIASSLGYGQLGIAFSSYRLTVSNTSHSNNQVRMQPLVGFPR
jgi:hypothetical protein